MSETANDNHGIGSAQSHPPLPNLSSNAPGSENTMKSTDTVLSDELPTSQLVPRVSNSEEKHSKLPKSQAVFPAMPPLGTNLNDVSVKNERANDHTKKGNDTDRSESVATHHHHHHHHHYHHTHHRPNHSQHSVATAPEQNLGNTVSSLATAERKDEAPSPSKREEVHASETSVNKKKSLYSPFKAHKPTLDKSSIVKLVEELFPQRKVLGKIVYNPTTTWETLQIAQLTGLRPEHYEEFEIIRSRFITQQQEQSYFTDRVRYIPMIPQLPQEYINSLLEIKIPYTHVIAFLQNLDEGNVAEDRLLWGGVGGIYTDDSDILHVLAHQGFFDNTIDLSEWNDSWTMQQPVPEDFKGDISVTVLLLPPLPAYHGFYANDINSRTWSGPNIHNGLSIALFNVEWGAPGTCYMDQNIVKRLRNEMSYDREQKRELKKREWSFDHDYYNKVKRKTAETEVTEP